MAISVDRQYYFRFSLGSKKDFIRERDFGHFQLIEEVGNALPTFSMEFETDDESVLPLLNEGNKLEVSFGPDIGNLISTPLAVTGIDSVKMGANRRKITLVGMYSAISYMSKNTLSISTAKSGVEVIADTVGKYFKFVGNITASKDSQRWIQYNISDRAHVNNIWLHCDVDPSFLAVGISSDGKFVAKDIKKDLSTPYVWRFTKTVKDQARDIVYDGDPHLKTQTGLMNAWMGYGREKVVYDLDTAIDTATLVNQEPLMAMTAKLAKNIEIEKRFASIGIQNDNTHSTYWQSYLRNLTSLASFHNVQYTLSFHREFKPVRILDQVMFKEEDVSNSNVSSEYLSGIYYVTRVSRRLENSQFVTVLHINRESLNLVQTGK